MVEEPAGQAEDKASGTVHIGGKPGPANWRKYLRITIWGVVAAITAVFLFSNSRETTVDLVFLEVQMPLFLVLFGTLLVGMFLGAGLWHFRNRLKEHIPGTESKTD